MQSETKSAIASAALHAGVLGFALLTFSGAARDATPPESMPIDLVSTEDFSKLAKGAKDAPKAEEPKPLVEKKADIPKPVEEQKPKPVEKKPEVEAARAETAPPAEKKPDPIAEKLKKEEPKQEAKPEETKKVELPPRKPPPPKPQPKFDADKIAALLDKTPDKRGAPQSATPPTKPTDYTGPTAGERQGNDTVLSAREQDLLLSMINQQLEPCARLPGGGGGPDTPIVNVRFQLNQDGSLNGEPVVVNRQNTPLYAIAADASVRAVKQCAPFQLPPDKYAAWSTVTWAFDWPVILGLVQR
jgi:colicin import membrane protein